MSEIDDIERLNEGIDAILAGRSPAFAAGGADLATALALAGELRDLPDREYKEVLRQRLFPGGMTMETLQETTHVMQRTGPGAHTIIPYFVLVGASDFLAFVESAFGGVERFRVPLPDGTLMHAEASIGDSLLEVGDANERYAAVKFPIHLYVEDCDAVYSSAIAARATSLYAPTDQVYGDREGGVEDRWGNHWYIGTRRETVRPAGFRTLTVGLRATGTARLLAFLERAFGARTVGDVDRTPQGAVAHGEIRIGDSIIEMGEPRGPFGPMAVNLHLVVPDCDAAYEAALEAGATSLRAPQDQPYGERSAGVLDPAGNTWWLATALAK
jgi:uncharacterized glyoxalase superfamily protein PhnB